MKTIHFLAACSVLCLTAQAVAQFPTRQQEQVPMKIMQTDEPDFPLALQNTTVMDGEAMIAINVDFNGKLIECLVTGYSRKEFADSAVAALRRWRFEPARVNGEPWPSVQEVRFDYSRTGVVISMTAMDALSNRMGELVQAAYSYRTYTLRELDRIPTPIEVVSPLAPALDPKEGKRTIVVDFYIDEQGRVRMPAVERVKADDVYAASAMVAVKQWRFEPPLCKNRPVLVHTQQRFDFLPKA